MFRLKAISLGLMLFTSNLAYAANMMSLTDDELSTVNAQALMSLTYLSSSDPSNLMSKYSNGSDVGFYKLGLEAEMELNVNIKNLQLGCGGRNGIGACDIDIKNLSLSGLNDGAIPSGANSGSPTFSQGRAGTSAKLTNPFAEFAIKNPENAATREIIGVRFSAEAIDGLLSAGLENYAIPSTTDGIQSLSGFMRLAATTGDVNTQATLFGRNPSHQIRGLLSALGQNRTFTSDPTHADTLGITVPSMNVDFTVPSFQVNGKRQTLAHIEGVKTRIDEIPLANGPNNQLRVNFPSIFVLARSAKVALKQGSRIENLNMDITFDQSLSMIHNIPLTGTGGYLSLQQQAILWPGNYIDPADLGKTALNQMIQSDVAQSGWWMSFAEPVDLGYLKATSPVNIDAVLPQVATLMTAELLKEVNRVHAPAGAAIGTIFGITMTTPEPVIVNLNSATLANPATLSLANLQLTNQQITSNCWGNLKFC